MPIDAGWASLGGGALDFAGGLIANATNAASAEANRQMQRTVAEQNLAFQLAAATQGIRWKVADAKAAGVHPLFALGAPSFNPSSVSVSGADANAVNPLRNMTEMGQNIDRAIQATRTAEERKEAELANAGYTRTIQEQQIASNALDLQIKQAQLDRMNRSVGPAFPGTVGTVPGVGQYEVKPPEVTVAQPAAAQVEAGPGGPEIGFRATDYGLIVYPAAKVPGLDDFDASNLYGIDHVIRNKLLGHVGRGSAPTLAQMRARFPDRAADIVGVQPYPNSLGGWRPIYRRGSQYDRYRNARGSDGGTRGGIEIPPIY